MIRDWVDLRVRSLWWLLVELFRCSPAAATCGGIVAQVVAAWRSQPVITR